MAITPPPPLQRHWVLDIGKDVGDDLSNAVMSGPKRPTISLDALTEHTYRSTAIRPKTMLKQGWESVQITAAIFRWLRETRWAYR